MVSPSRSLVSGTILGLCLETRNRRCWTLVSVPQSLPSYPYTQSLTALKNHSVLTLENQYTLITPWLAVLT